MYTLIPHLLEDLKGASGLSSNVNNPPLVKVVQGHPRSHLFLSQEQKEFMMDGLTEGRIVHFVMPDNRHRPAIIVNAHPASQEGLVNLHIFVDGPQELRPGYVVEPVPVSNGCDMWMASIMYAQDFKPGTWHWIEKA